MTIKSPVVSSGSQWLKTKYPNIEGITLGTTKLADDYFLVAEENLVSKDLEIGV